MELEFESGPSEDFLCDRYRVLSLADTADFVATYRALKAAKPDCSFLLTLDDLGQACYTSMHAKQRYDLDHTEGHDLSTLDPDCFEDGEHQGWLTTRQELFIRRGNIEARLGQASLADVVGKGITLFDASVEEFISANESILNCVDEDAFLLEVELPHSYQAIYAFPNGYFTDDLNPFENVVLARHMADEFGYELVGMGASLVAFLPEQALDEETCSRLVAFLESVYAASWDGQVPRLVRQYVEAGGLLVLRYIG